MPEAVIDEVPWGEFLTIRKLEAIKMSLTKITWEDTLIRLNHRRDMIFRRHEGKYYTFESLRTVRRVFEINLILVNIY